MIINKEEAMRFILATQGLLGEHVYEGKQGVRDFIKRVGCVQYDPIDVCGKTHEITLHSRVNGFRKKMLYDLLYKDRLLIDYFDKNMAILSIEDWPYFERRREKSKTLRRSEEEILAVKDEVVNVIKEQGPVSSSDIDFGKKVDWSWSRTSLSRDALDALYFEGKLIIHHKNNTRKFYDLSKRHIPEQIFNSVDPNQDDIDYYKWMVLRRIRAVGMLWNKSSDAFLGIVGFKSKQRKVAFKELVEEGEIVPITIKGIKDMFYVTNKDINILDKLNCSGKRTELIAPLDNMMWDRNLIQELFNFEYRWEVYTPAKKRKYGYYVLPVISGDKFISRVEVRKDKDNKVLRVENIWWEPNIDKSKYTSRLDNCFERIMNLHNFNYLVKV